MSTTLALALSAAPSPALAAPNDALCLMRIQEATTRLSIAYAAAQANCVRDLASGALEGSAQFCAQNPDSTDIDRFMQQLFDVESGMCAPAPGFGYLGAEAAQEAALFETVGLAADLFGQSLDLPVVQSSADPAAAACQEAVLRGTQGVHRAYQRIADISVRRAVRGKKRLTGTGPVTDETELAAEIEAQIDNQFNKRVGPAIGRLAADANLHCGSLFALGELFPGLCGDADSPSALSACLVDRAGDRVFRTLRDTAGLTFPCSRTGMRLDTLECAGSADIAHVLNRAGYGPGVWSQGRITALGIEAYIDEQLSPAGIDDSALDAFVAANYPGAELGFLELRENYDNNDPNLPSTIVLFNEVRDAKFLRSAASRRQLLQVLSDFWFNHFNVVVPGSTERFDFVPYERDVIRGQALGNFFDLLLATAKAPVMARYLDNRRNSAGAINENYGRELLELHTLGVDGGYTETDVREAAKAVTGWRINYSEPEGFVFVPGSHDSGEKQILSLTIPAGGGVEDGEQLMAFLSTHPSTAAFVAAKLIRRFVADEPPQALIDRVAQVHVVSGGDLRQVTRAVLMSPEFLLHPQNRSSKVKRPLVYVASMVRALGADPDPQVLEWRDPIGTATNMGEALFLQLPPTGYPDTSDFWIAPGSMLLRFNMVERAARMRDGFTFDYGIPSGSTNSQIVSSLNAKLMQGQASNTTLVGAGSFLDAIEAGGASENTRIEQGAAFLLSSPEFLRH